MVEEQEVMAGRLTLFCEFTELIKGHCSIPIHICLGKELTQVLPTLVQTCILEGLHGQQ